MDNIMPKFWEVITTCPIHKKNVYIRVEAANAPAAIKKAIGMVIGCPWGPLPSTMKDHSFVVALRDPEKEILGVSPLPWMPQAIVSSAPSLTPITPVPPTPLETRYYIKVDVQKRQLIKARWWQK